MARQTKAFLYCLLFFLLLELLARWIVASGPGSDDPSISPGSTCIVVGTSHAKRGLKPAFIEETLREDGIAAPFVAVFARKGITFVSLHEIYTSEVRPLALSTGRRILAIEVSPIGLNDSRLTVAESDYAQQIELLAPMAPLEEPPGLMSSLRQDLARGNFARAARALLRSLQLSKGPAPLLAALRSRPDDTPGTQAPIATGDKGWVPFDRPPPRGMAAEAWKRRLQEVLLEDFALGGIQTQALRSLIRLTRADGFQPVLYTMPVTRMWLDSFPPGLRERAIDWLDSVAREEGVRFIDLSDDHGLPDDAFHDVQHIGLPGVLPVSRMFAKDVLEPLLR